MRQLIVLVDSGWSKYTSRSIARARLGCMPTADDPKGDIALSNNLSTEHVIYDVLAVTLRSKLRDIASVFQQPAHVIICKDDGQSWRANIPRTVLPGGEQASGLAYKAGRHESDPASLAAMMKLNRMYDSALDLVCRYGGFNVVASKSVEADDFIVVMSNYYAQHNYNVIILSEDADIMQAVHRFDNGGHILVYRPRHKDQPFVCSPASLESAESTIFNIDTFDTAVKRISNPNVVASQYLLLHKILQGDASDAITPVMLRTSGSRHYKLRTADIDAIAKACADKHSMSFMPREALWEDIDLIISMSHELLFKQKFEDIDEAWQQFYKAKYVENLQMVCIDRCIMPQLWDSLQNYAAALPLNTINIDIPTLETLNRLGI